ncbi:response regulator [Sphingomonas sp. HF-S4]|uniref:Response regulator n=1 Tax=Sphingomonas agrestis TaxID=3080540 RepID=A0ABU3YD05_9SPHN|nr:response regulator [Sphingomonas sp. HF-S4]MDV3459280.1 response regulator [Sphingomonas sp. HF-S4]
MTMPLRVLIVEDEMTIALLIEDMVTDMGHEVAGMAMRLPQAVELAETGEFDFAILDVNLDGRRSFPVADVLSARGVPFIFATGYGSAGMEGAYVGQRVIKKPFLASDLENVIRSVA